MENIKKQYKRIKKNRELLNSSEIELCQNFVIEINKIIQNKAKELKNYSLENPILNFNICFYQLNFDEFVTLDCSIMIDKSLKYGREDYISIDNMDEKNQDRVGEERLFLARELKKSIVHMFEQEYIINILIKHDYSKKLIVNLIN